MRREFRESPFSQGVDEEIIYSLTTTAWGSSPTSVSVKVFDATTAKVDVTATVMPVNTPSVLGDVITLSPLKALTVGRSYRIEIKFSAGGNIFECYGVVLAED